MKNKYGIYIRTLDVVVGVIGLILVLEALSIIQGLPQWLWFVFTAGLVISVYLELMLSQNKPKLK